VTVEPPETLGMARKKKRVSAQEESVTVETSETLEIESFSFADQLYSGCYLLTALKNLFWMYFQAITV